MTVAPLIHIADGQSDELIGDIAPEYIIDDTHRQSLEDTLETYEFYTFGDQSFTQHLKDRNRIIIPDEDGTLREFIIYESEKYRDTEGYKMYVIGTASYLDLKKANVIRPGSFTGTASQHIGIALNDTEWRPGIVEVSGSRTLHRENFTNPFDYLKTLAREFEGELRFRIEHNGNRITGRFVDLLERIGEWRGREIEFGKDLDGIRRIENTERIVTALIGLGPEKEDGTRLEVFVEDTEALQRWGRPDPVTGELRHLIEVYEPESEREDMTEAELRQYTQTELNKRINAVVTYECSVVDLENVPGMEHKQIRFGDTIKIKDTKFNPPLYIEARVFEQERSIKSKAKKTIKLGDYIEYTEEEINAIWNQLRNEIKRRLDRMAIVSITSTAGNIFKNAQGTTELTARTFVNGVERDEDGTLYDYQWMRFDKSGNRDTDFYAEGKTITVTANDIDEKATYRVLVAYESEVINTAEITISNVFDGENGEPGPPGPKGEDGKTFYTWIKYADTPTSGMSDSPEGKEYIGIAYNKETPTPSTNYSDYIWAKFKGEQGVPGPPGEDGQPTYTWVKYADDEHGNGMSDSPEGKLYIGLAFNKTTPEESNNPADYTWSLMPQNIEIGGRNLLSNSSQEFRTITLRQWGAYNQYELIWHKPLEELGLKNGDYITLSMYFDDVSEENSVAMRFDFNREDNSYISSTGQQITKPGRYSFTAKIPDNEEFVKLSIRLMPKDSQSNYGYQIKYKEAKLEKGNRATDWTPAPEDIDEKFTDIEGTLASHSTKIEQNAQQIQLRATKAEVDTLSGRVSTVESTIQQHADMIESKIDDGQARSIFRQEASSFTFDADQINFKGHVFGEDATFTGRLEGASGLFTGSLITQDPSDNSGHPSKTEITYDTFSRQVHNAEDEYWTSVLIGSSISMSKYDYSGLFGPKPNAYYSGGFSISEEGINFGVRSASPSGWYSVTIDLDGIHYSDPNDAVFKEILFRDTDIAFNTNVNVTGSIIASKGWFDGQVFELSNASLLNIYIRPQSGGSVRFTEAGTTTSYVPIYASGLYANSVDVNTGTHVYIRPSSATGEVRITTTGTTDSYRPLRASNLFADSLDVQGGNAVHVYVRPRSTGSLAVTATGTTDNWRPVEASGFQNRSLERYKQDIELWNGSALDIIRNSEIYQYRSKTDVQNGIEKLKYGFVIGEGYRTPNEVITPSGESVDIYVQSSVAWKAIQELDSIQMNHEDRIAQLEQKIAELEAKIT